MKFDYVRMCTILTAFLAKEKSFCVDDFIDDDEDYADTHTHTQNSQERVLRTVCMLRLY